MLKLESVLTRRIGSIKNRKFPWLSMFSFIMLYWSFKNKEEIEKTVEGLKTT